MFKKLFVKKNKLLFLLTAAFISLLFILNHTLRLDPDFGWHLRMGELILQSGVPSKDPFSYSMPSYPFVDHEWLLNIVIAFLYHHGGFTMLTSVFVIVALSALFIQTVFVKRQWVLLPLILCALSLSDFMSMVRPQVFSWLFSSVLFVLFLHERLWQKFRYFLPLLMLFWVNLHGSFSFGIALIGFVVLLKQLQKKKFLWLDWVIVASTLATTLVNPYTWRVWWEVFMQMTDSSLRWSIAEWFPAVFFFNFAFLLYLALSGCLFIRYRKKFTLIEISLYLLLLLFGISSYRHLPFWLLFAIPLTARMLEYFYAEIKHDKWGEPRFWNCYGSLIGGVCFFALYLLGLLIQANLHVNLHASYPMKAIVYLKQHPFNGNLYSSYSWGGYLIWKFPEKKVFTDGRMPSWRSENLPSSESSNAFLEDQKFSAGELSFTQTTHKYNITTILLPLEISLRSDVQLSAKIISHLSNTPLVDPGYLHRAVRNAGWKQVYKDETTVIYQKPL